MTMSDDVPTPIAIQVRLKTAARALRAASNLIEAKATFESWELDIFQALELVNYASARLEGEHPG